LNNKGSINCGEGEILNTLYSITFSQFSVPPITIFFKGLTTTVSCSLFIKGCFQTDGKEMKHCPSVLTIVV
jgi:hypothetical protein